jgi:hypothetical protein
VSLSRFETVTTIVVAGAIWGTFGLLDDPQYAPGLALTLARLVN